MNFVLVELAERNGVDHGPGRQRLVDFATNGLRNASAYAVEHTAVWLESVAAQVTVRLGSSICSCDSSRVAPLRG